MSLLFRRPRLEERSFVQPILPSDWYGGYTKAGQSVIPDNASRSAAVNACRRVIVASILGMGVESFKRDSSSGRWVKNPTTPSIVKSPSIRVRQRAWIAQMVNSMILHGNAYGLVTGWDAMGRPAFVEPLHWSAVSWSKDADGQDVATVAGKAERPYPVGRLLVIPATPYLLPGSITAQSPVELAKQAIGAGLAAEEFASTFFRDGAFPSSVLYSDQELTPTAAQGFKDRIMASVTGNREPVVLGTGLKWETMNVDPPTWAIDLLRFEVEQACRFFGVPPTMVYGSISGQAVTYSNVNQSETSFFKLSLKSWLDDLEDGWSALLPEGQSVKLNVDDFLRMDAESRHKDQQVRLANKSATVNEVRLEEDKDPFEGDEFDEPGLPGAGSDEVSEMSDEERIQAAAKLLQQVYLAVDVVLSAEEARAMVSAMGVPLPGDLPTDDAGNLADDESES